MAVLVALPFLAAIGCGDDERSGAAATRVDVTLSDFAVDPDEIRLDGPGTYTFVARNEGTVDHVFEVEGDGLEEETEEIPPGGTAVLTVRLEAKRYKTYCPLGDHEDKGMVGTIVVGSG